MADDTLSRLRRIYQTSPGMLLHDWGDSAAVVFVAGTGTTHLISGDVAALLADWEAPGSTDDLDAAEADWLQAQLPTLLQTGILQARPPA